MKTPSESLRASLMSAAKKYRSALQGADHAREYLRDRGLTDETVRRFGLGYVADPETGHEMMRGRLAIPYVTKSKAHGMSVVTIKFRALGDEMPKYLGPSGQERPLFHPEALHWDTDYICIAEGEIDCMSLVQCGIPAVGISGADKWKANPHLSRLFKGYDRVLVFKDVVKKQQKKETGGDLFANSIARTVDNVHIIPMPDDDVNHALVTRGEDYLKGLVK